MNNVAILGYGVIGSSVDKIITKLNNPDIKVTKVLDIPQKKDVLGDRLVSDYNLIAEDPTIKVVVEALGGDEFPYKAITACLKNGKSVLTSNKETVSKHFDEYLKLAKEHHCYFLFEASVGGGIPLLHPIIDILKYDDITSFKGIVNGTTNYILTRVGEGSSFTDALKEAQAKGFAERDPSSDLKGVDVLRKGVILSDLAFRTNVDYQKVPVFGIDRLDDEIYKKINSLDNKILKLVVEGKLLEDNKMSLIVVPTIVDANSILGMMRYENNGCTIDCKLNDTLTFIGKGAGGFPTASAMINDLLNILNHNAEIDRSKTKDLELVFDSKAKFMVFDENNKSQIISVPNAEELKKYKFVAKIGE